MKSRLIRLLPIAIFLIGAVPLWAQEQGLTDAAKKALAESERDQLMVADYKTVPLFVALEPNDFGLSVEAIRTRTELRMRAVGLTPSNDFIFRSYYLRVFIDISGDVFQARVEFNRRAEWTLPNGKKTGDKVAAWSVGVIGGHRGNPKFVLDRLEELIDRFLNAYLKANQDEK